ncbi:MAG: hypothetical protein ABIR24_14895 [Verrucomicrobiota bacterium]
MTACASQHQQVPKAQLKPGPLRVEVTASTNEVRLKESFKLVLRVENISKTDQTIRVMSCSWDQHWQSSNPAVSWVPWDCSNNFAMSVKLAPGNAYTNQMEMLVPQPTKEKKLSFRMGFTPLESTNTLWSNEVTIKVE